jgi:hypothetical protein
MRDTFISSDFLGSTTQERVDMCRKLAAEAGRHAEAAANPETKRAYFELQRQWELLASEMEMAAVSDTTNKRP